MRIPILFFALVASGCNHSTSPGAPLDLGPSFDLAPSPTPTASLTGTVWDGLCQPVIGASVSVRGQSTNTTTDTDGHFALSDIPADAVLDVEAVAHAPTLSVRRALPSSGTDLLLLLVPSSFVSGAYALAGQSADSNAGTVALALAGTDRLPVGGATLTLQQEGGAPIEPIYLSASGTTFSRDGSATAASTGAAVFLNLLPGDYQLTIAGTNLSFGAIAVPVAAGYVTADVLFADAPSGAPPITLRGSVTGLPLYPGAVASPSPSPLPSASVTLTTIPDLKTLTATTAADGTWRLDVPFGFRDYDLTSSAPGYATSRDYIRCLSTTIVYADGATTLNDPNWQYDYMNTALHGQPPVAADGVIRALVPTGNTVLIPPGTTVTIEPQLASADYGVGYQSWPDPCVTQASCGSTSDCPSGSRCEGGECLQGDAPYCSRCGAGYQCPAGTLEQFYDMDESQCFCVTAVESCLTEACPADTDCSIRWSYSNESGPYQQVCLPWRSPLVAAVGSLANFANVPPGIYTVSASAPGYQYFPSRVRVDGSVFTTALLLWETTP